MPFFGTCCRQGCAVLEFQHPGMLALLALAPVLWLLHKLRDRGADRPVAALFLWNAATADNARGHRLTRADPAWRRRALFAMAACLALSGPTLISESPPVTVWVDDSPSMLAVEGGQTRLELAGSQLERRLEPGATGPIHLRSLAHPERSVEVNDASQVAAALRAWPVAQRTLSVPPAALMDPARAHWLVSDGADAAIADWTAVTPLEEIVQVGSQMQNVSIASISARPSAADPTIMEALIDIRGSSGGEGQRTLVVTGPSETTRRTLDIVSGRNPPVTVTFPRGQRLEARLEPADALAIDDTLVIEAAATRTVAASVSHRCPGALRESVAAIVSIAPDPLAAGDSLAVECGALADFRPAHTATLMFITSSGQYAALRDPVWSRMAERLGNVVVDSSLRVVAGVELPGEPLLASDDRSLITLERAPGRPPVIYVALDVADTSWSDQPSFPIIIARLAESVLDRDLLDPVARAAQPLAGEALTPRHELRASRSPTASAGSVHDLSGWILSLAILFALADLGRFLANNRRARSSIGEAGA